LHDRTIYYKPPVLYIAKFPAAAAMLHRALNVPWICLNIFNPVSFGQRNMKSLLICAALALAAVLAARAAHADVTYDFVPSTVTFEDHAVPWGTNTEASPTGCAPTADGSPCYAIYTYTYGMEPLSLTFTDAVVARGSTIFCNDSTLTCPSPSYSGLVGETGLDAFGDFASHTVIGVAFNPDGSLSGTVTNCGNTGTGIGPGTSSISIFCQEAPNSVVLTGNGDDWSGSAGFFNSPYAFESLLITGAWHETDPADPVPAPGALALFLPALGLFAAARRFTIRFR
jgi:hypothetical protein